MSTRLRLQWVRFAACAAVAATAVTSAGAQSAVLKLPDLSQGASVTQRIGITGIAICFHRPLTRGRRIFGGLVPYGQVWRAGADMNTVIAFSDPVTVEGKQLPAGRYGLFMIPEPDIWTVIFSNNSTSWGAFSYHRSEDALRIQVKPKAISGQRALVYEFVRPRPDSVDVAMRWDNVEVSFPVGIATDALVQSSLPLQLRGRAGLIWQPWEEAANYLLHHHLDARQAEYDARQAIGIDDCFETEITEARALAALGRSVEAAAARKQALAMAHSQFEVYIFARTLQNFGERRFPLAIFRENIADGPETWIAHEEKMRLAVAAGDFKTAKAEGELAVGAGPPSLKPALEGYARQVDEDVDINQ
ncbi:MAG: DUF2911 domain-containing protein [Terriglobales bacterium]